MNLLLNINIIVSIVQKKSSLQNVHEDFVKSLWMNLLLNINVIVSIVQQNLPYNFFLWMSLLLNMNIIVSIVQPTFRQKTTFK